MVPQLRISALFLAINLIAAPTAISETLYVTDILRLGLHHKPDTSDRPFRVLVSGDTLEVIERSPYYALVRLADGAEGWVKVSYLVEEKPALTQLTDLTRERDRLASEAAGLRSRIGHQDGELERLRSDRDGLENNAVTVATELSTLRHDNQSLRDTVAANRLSVRLQWLLAIAAATLVGGFVAGFWWTDGRQRARHGGFRI